jgi:hypothetical protein
VAGVEFDFVRRLESARDDGDQAGEGNDVEAVVLEDGFERAGAPGAEEAEVEFRDELAGDIAGARVAEDAPFELDEAAALEAELPQAAGAVEEIEVLEAGEGRAAPGQAVAGFEQRLVESLAVVGHEHVEGVEVFGEAVERGGLVGEVAEEELADVQALGRNAADASDEGDRAGAAGESAGFGVEESDAVRGDVRDRAVGDGGENCGGEPGQIGRVEAAVGGVELLHLPVAAVFGFHFGAGQLLRGAARVLFVDLGGLRAQKSDLRVEVLERGAHLLSFFALV